MPRVSAKKKARTAATRAMAKKRWEKAKDSVGESVEGGGGGGCSGGVQQQVADASLEPPTQSAASFRHSLLPEDQKAEEGTVSNGMYTISHHHHQSWTRLPAWWVLKLFLATMRWVGSTDTLSNMLFM